MKLIELILYYFRAVPPDRVLRRLPFEVTYARWWNDDVQAMIDDAMPKIKAIRTSLRDRYIRGELTDIEYDKAWGDSLCRLERCYSHGVVGHCVHELGLPFLGSDGYERINRGRYSPTWN